MVLDRVAGRVFSLGARPARPGEFTERAFLNGKLDLVQAEAVADLIDAATHEAARLARRSLDGALSERVNAAVADLVEIRTFIEGPSTFRTRKSRTCPRISSRSGSIGSAGRWRPRAEPPPGATCSAKGSGWSSWGVRTSASRAC